MIGAIHNGYSKGHTYLFKGFYNDYTSTTTADVVNPDIDGRVKIGSRTAKNTMVSATFRYKMETKTGKHTYL